MNRSVRVSVLVCLLMAAALAAGAAVVPTGSTRFDNLIQYDPSARLSVVAERPEGLPGYDKEMSGWSDFKAAHGPGWTVWVDRRSGSPTLVEGEGIRWFPAGQTPSFSVLEAKAREFVSTNAFLLKVRGEELVLNLEGSAAVDRDHAILTFNRLVEGVPVEDERFTLYVVRGNLVAFGADRWGTVTPRRAVYSAVTAREVLFAYMGLTSLDQVEEVDAGTLAYISAPPGSGPSESWKGEVGKGIDHRLVWRIVLRVAGERGTWVGKVDAETGEVLAFYDDNKYGQVRGGVFPVSNDGQGWDGTEQPGWPMPYADATINGTPYTANDMGMFDCTPVGGTATTTLIGPYIRVYDYCGAMNQSAVCDNDLDLLQSPGTDCAIPAGMSAGDTHSARSCFYHLNRVMEKGRAWLPDNTWLRQQLTSNVNINSTCNAYWSGSVNFYRSGGGCRNTGEIAGVFVHEWGHGIDQNDGGGYDNPSEAYADIVAFIQTHVSCIGRGFFETGNCSGYGDSCLNCSGIRDQDWDMRTNHTPATPQGFLKTYCGGGGGPCGKETHCESYVSAEAVWDLAARDLPAAGMDADTAWQLTDKLFYKSRNGSGGNAYNCDLAANTSDGCGAGSWFTKFRTVDDDDGNLSNGTPHAAAIFAAFNRHNIACGTANDTSNKNFSTCPTLAKPTLTVAAGSNSANLSWTAVPGAASYLILRNDQGCNTAHTIIATVPAPTTSYVDTDLPNGFPVYYAVQAQGTNTACESALSNCVAATPQPFAGSIKLGQATYACSSVITVTVTDANVGAPTVTATIWSTTESTPETLILTETYAGSAKYIATITATGGPSGNGDGMLAITHGDVITAQYVDADDGQGGHGLPRQTTASGDCLPPMITQVGTSSVTDVRATINWTTDEGSTSVVHWGPLRPPASTNSTPGLTTTHAVNLTGLQSCTVYYYSVESTDTAGNPVVDTKAGEYYHFETLGNFGSGLQSCHAGKVILSRNVYSCSDAVSVRLSDIDVNNSPTLVDTITVEVTSTSESTPETLTLTETGANTSTFTASIPTSGGAVVQGDGVLQTRDGDVITVTYHDANDGAGSPAISFATAASDCTGPVIQSVQVTDVSDYQAAIRWTTNEPSTSRVEWGTTPALGTVVSDSSLVTSHYVTLGVLNECASYYFRISSTDTYGYLSTADAAGSPFVFNAGQIGGALFKDTFETLKGWTLQGEWQIGAPQGRGTAPGDPTAAFDGAKVLGHDLTGLGAHPGDYELNSNERASSPPIDCTASHGTQIVFRRWLNVKPGTAARASIYVTRNNVPFPAVWSSSNEANSAWQMQTVDIGSQADGANAVKIAFEMNGGAATPTAASWNLDRVVVRDGSAPMYTACGGCTGTPTFGGIFSAADADPCAATGIRLSWPAAPAWGTGTGGSYAVYRGTTADFLPSGANLVAKGILGTSHTDTTAPTNVTLYYIVRAESNETCSSGPQNGGTMDSNLVRLSARDEVSQTVPGDIASLKASPQNDAHVRLSWTTVPSAASYHVYRAPAPQGPFTQIGQSSGLFYDDLNQMGNTTNWYYKVKPADACGREAP